MNAARKGKKKKKKTKTQYCRNKKQQARDKKESRVVFLGLLYVFASCKCLAWPLRFQSV